MDMEIYTYENKDLTWQIPYYFKSSEIVIQVYVCTLLK